MSLACPTLLKINNAEAVDIRWLYMQAPKRKGAVNEE
jgi:hypothetical protein